MSPASTISIILALLSLAWNEGTQISSQINQWVSNSSDLYGEHYATCRLKWTIKTQDQNTTPAQIQDCAVQLNKINDLHSIVRSFGNIGKFIDSLANKNKIDYKEFYKNLNEEVINLANSQDPGSQAIKTRLKKLILKIIKKSKHKLPWFKKREKGISLIKKLYPELHSILSDIHEYYHPIIAAQQAELTELLSSTAGENPIEVYEIWYKAHQRYLALGKRFFSGLHEVKARLKKT